MTTPHPGPGFTTGWNVIVLIARFHPGSLGLG